MTSKCEHFIPVGNTKCGWCSLKQKLSEKGVNTNGIYCIGEGSACKSSLSRYLKEVQHDQLMDLWRRQGRDPVVQVPQYERADGMAVSQYYRPRVDRYAFQGRD